MFGDVIENHLSRKLAVSETVANRDYHYLSQSEIAGAKRISQQLFPLSGPGGQNLAEERLKRDCLSGALLS
jgi:predicted component of type VI protein secretion system